MLKVLIYVFGLVTGAALMQTIRRCAERAAREARKAAMKEFRDQQDARNDAYSRGYNRARREYANMTEVERFASAFEGRRVKTQVRGA